MKSQTTILSVVLALALAVGASCGGDDFRGISLSLEFKPRDLPQDTTTINYYVLPLQLSDGSQAACEDFMGSQAEKSVLDYSTDFVKRGGQSVSATESVTLTLAELPEGMLMFYIEAASTSQVLACGCGQGQVKRGEKVVIPIRLATDCRK